MTRTLLAIGVAGVVFASVSGPSQAAPIAPPAGVFPPSSLATPVSWHSDHGDYHRKSGHRHGGGLMSRFGGFRSLLGMLGNGHGDGLQSMMAGLGGSGGIASMMSSMGGSGGMTSMMSAMGGGGMASMMGGGGGGGGSGEGSESARQACTPDAMRLCSDAIPDVAKVKACMMAKSSQLSDRCRAAMNGAGGTETASVSRGLTAPAATHEAHETHEAESAPAHTRFTGFRGGRDFGNYSDRGYGNYEGDRGFSRGGRDFGSYEGGQGYGDFGGQGMDIGRMMGMARQMGFGSGGDWRD
jgi:hypothetical protein